MSNKSPFQIKKKFGQHFLINETIAEQIVNQIDYLKYEQILEIGPGTGVLSKYLVQYCDPILIEVDEDAVNYLKQTISKLKTIILGDFLKIDLKILLKRKSGIIGNFPYNISTQILFKILEHKECIHVIVGMFQKEVAERVCSNPNTKKYGIISVLIQAYYNCEILFDVKKNNFKPPPNVESCVIRLTRNSLKTLNCNEKTFALIVKMSFNQRRKKIKNSLKTLTFKSNKKINILMMKRPEQLGIKDFVLLTSNLNSYEL